MKKLKMFIFALLLLAVFFLGSYIPSNSNAIANATSSSSNLSIVDMLSITDKTLYKVLDSKNDVTCYIIMTNNRLDSGSGIDCK